MANPTYTLISKTTFASATSTLTLSSIPATYDDLLLRVCVRNSSSGSSNDVFIVQPNSSGSNISSYGIYGVCGSSGVSLSGFSTTNANGYNNDSSTVSNTLGASEYYFAGYRNSGLQRNILLSAASMSNRTGSGVLGWQGARWNNTSAISSLLIYPNSGNFNAGGQVYLYGISYS